MTTTITILCGMGEYPVDLPEGLTVDDLPRLIEGAGGIVVPWSGTEVSGKMFIPSSQIQAITWVDSVVTEAEDAEVADVAYIGEEEPGTYAEGLVDIEDPGVVDTPATGPNGEVFIDV